MENSIVIDQFWKVLDCRVEITSSAPDYVFFPLRGAAWETLHCIKGRLSRQSRKLIGAHLQLVEAQLYADLTIPFTVTVPSYFLYVQLRGSSGVQNDQELPLPGLDRPYVFLCFYPADQYSLQFVQGLHSVAVIALEEEWFSDLGEHYPAFRPLTEARANGKATCYQLPRILLYKMMLDLLDVIRFTAIKGLQDSARVVQLLAKLLHFYHVAVAAATTTLGPSTEALRLALDCYLEQHYMDEQYCSIRQIKKSLGWKRRSSEQVVKDSLGCTLRRYVVEFRIRKACALLVETDAKISDIAYQTGFSDLAHFTNSFKRSTGMSPSVYRKKNS